MNIQNLRRISGAGTLVATFDLQATPDIILNDWQLRQTRNGLRAFPPSPRNGRPAALIAAETFAEIGRLARTVFEGGNAHNVSTH